MMTFMPPGGPQSGPPQGPPQAGQDPMAQQGAPGGEDPMALIMQIAQMLLGRPPQSQQELMQVIQVLASMQGGEGAAQTAGGMGSAQPEMPAANSAMVRAVNGGF